MVLAARLIGLPRQVDLEVAVAVVEVVEVAVLVVVAGAETAVAKTRTSLNSWSMGSNRKKWSCPRSWKPNMMA